MVEDYTNAFLVSAFCLVFMALFVIWAMWGLIVALGTGWAADTALAALPRNPD